MIVLTHSDTTEEGPVQTAWLFPTASDAGAWLLDEDILEEDDVRELVQDLTLRIDKRDVWQITTISPAVNNI